MRQLRSMTVGSVAWCVDMRLSASATTICCGGIKTPWTARSVVRFASVAAQYVAIFRSVSDAAACSVLPILSMTWSAPSPMMCSSSPGVVL